MSKILFKIGYLECSYQGDDPVLRISNLVVRHGALTVILGSSGSGKSTLLETLGLMSKTFNPHSTIVFTDGFGKDFSYQDLWAGDRTTELEAIRNEHFSFIFQETNLMKNFTAYENVCLSQMIQNVSMELAVENATCLMRKIGLEEISFHKRTNELSGGQKQRLAFIRAISPKYTVLFGDEPTGNLDEKTSIALMQLIRDDIDQKGVSAVIVSHNIQVSLKFADEIMVITKKGSVGELLPEHRFCKRKTETGFEEWVDSHDNRIGHIEDSLRNLL